MAEKPMWRSSFDVVERSLGSIIGRVTKSEALAVAVGLAQTVQRDVSRRAERASRRVLHLLNLPAGSDITRLLRQMGSVERQVRDLEKRLEDGAGRSEGR
jgi:hypothetical protein